MNKVFVIALLSTFVTSALSKEWWETASFYQIYPQSFKDGGGGNLPGTGDLKGITDKLDYFKDLGIDCLWINPIFQSSFGAFGYDITNYTDIDPRYGSIESFETLIKSAHEKGIKVIVDFVPNHCGVNHEFFQNSINKIEPFTDYFLWDAGKPNALDPSKNDTPSNWQRLGDGPGSAWNYDATRKEYFYAVFYKNMPDLNLRNEKVVAYLESVMEFWMDRGVDGFRIDAISFGIEANPDSVGVYPDEEINKSNITNPKDYGYLIHDQTVDRPELFQIIYRWRKLLDNYKNKHGGDTRIIMTESYSSIDQIKKFYGDGTSNGAHLPFNFQMINELNKNSTADAYVKMADNWFSSIPASRTTNWVIGNHDQSRVVDRFGENKVDIMNTMVTMLPGTSVTYYGEEIGMSNSCAYFEGEDHNQGFACAPNDDRGFQDHWVRSPFQWDDTVNGGFSTAPKTWLPVALNYKEVNLKAQMANESSHYNVFKKLIALRKNKAIMEGKFVIKTLTSNSFAFKRELEDTTQQSILVIINVNGNAEKVNLTTLGNIPNLMTIKIVGGNSKHTIGEQVNTKDLQLEGYESIVAFYNGAMSLLVSKVFLFCCIMFCI
ncbi:unnamed protein product [Diamesa serratosioi]